jgi:hypothetical protein
MHTPAAHAYNATFNVSISEPADDGSLTLHAGMASGTFIAGPYAGQSFRLSGFDLRKKSVRNDRVEVFGGTASPIAQTLSLVGGGKFERLCILTILTSPLPYTRPQL